jgi:hypothetical protein
MLNTYADEIRYKTDLNFIKAVYELNPLRIYEVGISEITN